VVRIAVAGRLLHVLELRVVLDAAVMKVARIKCAE